jgi:hypothetical protein
MAHAYDFMLANMVMANMVSANIVSANIVSANIVSMDTACAAFGHVPMVNARFISVRHTAILNGRSRKEFHVCVGSASPLSFYGSADPAITSRGSAGNAWRSIRLSESIRS